MTRHERAIERDKARAIATRSTWSSFDADCAINAYEAELDADLESNEVVERAARVMAETFWRGSADGSARCLPVDSGWRDAMRAALWAALEG